jgi:hypothetical protein
MINLMLKAIMITYLYLRFLCKCVKLAHLYKALRTPWCHLIPGF